MTRKVYLQLTYPLFWLKKDCMVGFYTVHANNSAAGFKVGATKKPQAHTVPALVSFACIIHVISTNYLGLVAGKYLVELMDTVFLYTSAIAHCNQVYIPNMSARLFAIEQNCGY